MEQVDGNIKADDFLNRYLVSLMRGNSKDYHTGVAEIPGTAYVRYWITSRMWPMMLRSMPSSSPL